MRSNKSQNPFTLSFGIEPPQYIARYMVSNEIIETFTVENPTSYVYMISGVRGSGKTVLLSNLADTFGDMEDWIVINVTPDADILTSVAAKLYSIAELKRLFVNAKLDFSALGLGVSVEASTQIFDIEVALERMLNELKKKNKRVLITIDEVVRNDYVKRFSSSFQLMLRGKLPVFLIMTGLYENIYELQNEKSLTFLYRAPKVMLEPLGISSIARSYEALLDVDKDTAMEMAKLTKGYAFAYQALGYLYYKEYIAGRGDNSIEAILPEYDELLESYVYEKIWTELSPVEQDIVGILAKTDEAKVEEVRDALDMKSNIMSVYRDRLKKKGIVDTSRYGRMSLKLPRFGNIISYWTEQ